MTIEKINLNNNLDDYNINLLIMIYVIILLKKNQLNLYYTKNITFTNKNNNKKIIS